MLRFLALALIINSIEGRPRRFNEENVSPRFFNKENYLRGFRFRDLIDAHSSVPWPIGAASRLNNAFTRDPKQKKTIDRTLRFISTGIIIGKLPVPWERAILIYWLKMMISLKTGSPPGATSTKRVNQNSKRKGLCWERSGHGKQNKKCQIGMTKRFILITTNCFYMLQPKINPVLYKNVNTLS